MRKNQLLIGQLLGMATVLALAGNAFAATPLVTSSKVTSPSSVTIVFSEPVNTAKEHYSNFTGGLYGRTLSSVSGSGTANVILNFTGSPFAYDATGNITISSSTVSSADSAAFTNGNITVTDGQTPKILSLTMQANSNSKGESLFKTDDAVTLSFTVSKSVEAPKVIIDGKSAFPTGSGTGPFSVSYNKSATDGQDSSSFSITLKDSAGNTSTVSGSFALNGAAVVSQPATTPAPAAPAQSTGGAPKITLVTLVPERSESATPSFTFNSTVAGTLKFTGDCSTQTVNAVAGNNTVTFNALPQGAHNNCTFTVTDSAGVVSNTIFLPTFTIGSAPSAEQVAASPSNNFKFTKLLIIGLVDNEVTELQKRLTVEGFYSGPITGKFGSLTKAAVIAYQKAKGIDPRGHVGPGTRAALNGE